MRRVVVPVGTRFGFLTLVRNDLRQDGGDGKPRWANLLRCGCGGELVCRNGRLTASPPKYCGHDCGLRWAGNDKGIGIKAADGFGGLPGWYRSYVAMRSRCLGENDVSFKDYGGRGIKICDRWLNDPMVFYKDMGERPQGHTIDRKDVNGNYEPANCRWADAKTQSANKRNSH